MLRQTLNFAVTLLAVSLLGACSSSTPEQNGETSKAAAEQGAAAEERQPTVFDDQLKALDKAKSVEATLQKAQQERDKKMEEQSDG